MHRFTEAERRDVGRWLQQLRKVRWSSREDMAEASGNVGVSTIYAIETGARGVSEESMVEYLRLLDMTLADVLRHRGISEADGPPDGSVLPHDPSLRLGFADYPVELRAFALAIMRWLWMLPLHERREELARITFRMAGAPEGDDG